jgi:hypothetical protein
MTTLDDISGDNAAFSVVKAQVKKLSPVKIARAITDSHEIIGPFDLASNVLCCLRFHEFSHKPVQRRR